MSSSRGELSTLRDVLEIYEPEIVRYLFAGTRPNREFSISFDADVIKVYEDFDRCERVYFDLEKPHSEEDVQKQKVAYELSFIGKIPKTIPYQPSFRHLTVLLQIHQFNMQKVIGYYLKELKNEHDKTRLQRRAECAKHWLQKFAPEEFCFTVQEQCLATISSEERTIVHQFASKLLERSWTDVDLHEEIYILCKNSDFPIKDFFTVMYRILINKDKGPRLASFILEIGKERVAALLKKV